MSDSEDEGAFASADEGDSPTKSKPKEHKERKESPAKKGGAVPKASGDSADSGQSKTKMATAPADNKKKGKQQQQQKKKGKNVSQQPSSPKVKESENAPTDSKSSPGSDKTSPRKTDTAADEKQVEKQKLLDTPKVSKETPPTPNSDSTSDKCEAATTQSVDSKVEGEGESKTKQAGDIRKGIGTSSPQTQSMGRQGEGREEQSQGSKASGTDSQKNSGGGWGWSGWGSSILSAASNSVQTFTDQLGDGLSTIIDSVESSLGVPDPEEMAKSNVAQETDSTLEMEPVTQEPSAADTKTESQRNPEKKGEDISQQKGEIDKSEEVEAKGGAGGGWFSSWGVADIAKKMQDTGKSLASKGTTLVTEGFDKMENLASGGIDVLESIGKKTYDTLSEHDPAFKKTREYLGAKSSKPNLSSVLREAKEVAEEEAAHMKESEEARKAHYETQLDEYQGIAHLEALEMLSNQSEKKVHSLLNSLSSSDLKAIKPVLISIKEVFEVEEQEDSPEDKKDQDFSSLVSKHLSELELGTAPDKLGKVHDMVKQWMTDFEMQESYDKETAKTIHQQAIQSLAELTSKGVEQFHKAGELVLMQRDSDKDCKERAHSFARLTGVLCHEIGNLATKFTDCLNKTVTDKEEESDVTSLVTNVYLEATNSSTYIQDAFQLLLPILQHAAIEHAILSRQS